MIIPNAIIPQIVNMIMVKRSNKRSHYEKWTMKDKGSKGSYCGIRSLGEKCLNSGTSYNLCANVLELLRRHE